MNAPPHPGILLKEIMLKKGLSIMQLSKKTGVAYHNINNIINFRMGVGKETADRIADFTKISAKKWKERSNYQKNHRKDKNVEDKFSYENQLKKSNEIAIRKHELNERLADADLRMNLKRFKGTKKQVLTTINLRSKRTDNFGFDNF